MRTSYLLAAALLASAAANAEAAIITQTFTINATNFTGGAPIDPVSGIFSFTYDKDAIITPQSATGLTISGFNLPYDGAALFQYQKGGDFLTVSNNFTGFFAFTVGGAGQKFGFNIMNLSTNPSIASLTYSVNGQIYTSNAVSVTQAAPVPEPASWAMMIGGFGLVGGAMRSSRRGSMASVAHI